MLKNIQNLSDVFRVEFCLGILSIEVKSNLMIDLPLSTTISDDPVCVGIMISVAINVSFDSKSRGIG